jgi:hypothetical protein
MKSELLVAADVSPLKYPNRKSEPTCVGCYNGKEIHP